jgi:hypothetical protein
MLLEISLMFLFVFDRILTVCDKIKSTKLEITFKSINKSGLFNTFHAEICKSGKIYAHIFEYKLPEISH